MKCCTNCRQGTFLSGFTLIELLVVISIIGLLSSVILASVQSSREKAKMSAMLQFEYQIKTGRGDDLQAEYEFDGNLENSFGSAVGDGSISFANTTPFSSGQSLLIGGNGGITVPLDVSESRYTVSFWFRSDRDGGIFQVGGGGGYDRNIWLTGGTVCARLYSEEQICTDEATYADDTWHYLVHSYGGATGGQELYLDGKLAKKGTKNNSDWDGQTNITIGNSTSYGGAFYGYIDRFRIYAQSLGG